MKIEKFFWNCWKCSTKSENFSKIGGEISNRGKMHHGLKRDGRPCHRLFSRLQQVWNSVSNGACSKPDNFHFMNAKAFSVRPQQKFSKIYITLHTPSVTHSLFFLLIERSSWELVSCLLTKTPAGAEIHPKTDEGSSFTTHRWPLFKSGLFCKITFPGTSNFRWPVFRRHLLPKMFLHPKFSHSPPEIFIWHHKKYSACHFKENFPSEIFPKTF